MEQQHAQPMHARARCTWNPDDPPKSQQLVVLPESMLAALPLQLQEPARHWRKPLGSSAQSGDTCPACPPLSAACLDCAAAEGSVWAVGGCLGCSWNAPWPALLPAWVMAEAKRASGRSTGATNTTVCSAVRHVLCLQRCKVNSFCKCAVCTDVRHQCPLQCLQGFELTSGAVHIMICMIMQAVIQQGLLVRWQLPVRVGQWVALDHNGCHKAAVAAAVEEAHACCGACRPAGNEWGV